MANNPPLTSDPIEFDPQTRRYRWTRPWWVYFDSFRRETAEVGGDEDVLDAFQETLRRIPVDGIESLLLQGADAAVAKSAIQIPAGSAKVASGVSLQLIQRAEAIGLQAALLALSMQRSWSTFRAIADTAANIGNYAPATWPSAYYVATDTFILYRSDGSAWAQIIPFDDAYGAGWNGSTKAPTQNSVYDKIETLLGSSAYTPTNVTPDRSYDANGTTVEELADVLGTLISDLQGKGILS